MPTRRDFLKSVCGVAAIAIGPVLLADDAMAADGIVRKANGQVVVTVARIPSLAKVGGIVNLGTVKGLPVAVVRTGSTTYRALSLRCTHEGATVRPTGSRWTCPRHGSQFNLDGSLVRGPANRALNTVLAKLKAGKLTVG
jgi:Rieske Fe-S protein